MKLEREWIENLIYGSETARRFTQDSPILPDVWIGYGTHPDEFMDLLLTPFGGVRPGVLAMSLQKRVSADSGQERELIAPEIAYNRSSITAKLSFSDMCRVALPLSDWWYRTITKPNLNEKDKFDPAEALIQVSHMESNRCNIQDLLARYRGKEKELGLPLEVLLMAHIIGAITRGLATTIDNGTTTELKAWHDILDSADESLNVAAKYFEKVALFPSANTPLLYAINRNRKFYLSVWRSCQTVKADAANRLFMSSCREITWAVVDSGIDATHSAFRQRDPATGCMYTDPFVKSPDGSTVNQTRVKAAYDFTLIRTLLQVTDAAIDTLPEIIRNAVAADPRLKECLDQLKTSLLFGREVDWSLLEPLLLIPPDDARAVPTINHGTHVAGIIAADWENHAQDGLPFRGMCPDINLLDIRVMSEKGEGDEFTLIAALQYLRWLNAHKDFQVVHGANISLAIPHDVANYACGRTPVCEECERLVNTGLVVVAAAGNKGYLRYMTSTGMPEDGYLSISITDPGNAEGVITVGSTHRIAPHTYGVSYFSSRGPTGDGRYKPDLVAPGEKIESTVPNEDSRVLDGTSMAAPHVSGAAALLMARHRELMGNPQRIKQILCETATDLGRERYFQGCGLVDVLRAIQST